MLPFFIASEENEISSEENYFWIVQIKKWIEENEIGLEENYFWIVQIKK